jgi:hypothetical protein
MRICSGGGVFSARRMIEASTIPDCDLIRPHTSLNAFTIAAFAVDRAHPHMETRFRSRRGAYRGQGQRAHVTVGSPLCTGPAVNRMAISRSVIMIKLAILALRQKLSELALPFFEEFSEIAGRRIVPDGQ